MGKIQSYTISIVLDTDSDLMRRIQASADERGISFRTALEEAVNIGLWPHIERNLNMVERLRKEEGKL